MVSEMVFDYCDSPLGPLLLAAGGQGLAHVDLPHEARPTVPRPDWRRDRAALAEARRQLRAYFDGQAFGFTVKIKPHGTPFQLAVWAALRDIPCGQTTSYGEIARRIGRPRAVRAVGAANGANPLAIIVPCHRVIGADGSLTGYGGGLPAKQWLLAHERRHAPVAALELRA
ncbi:MAG TPA: methylated-DNA--[protein]-cysteine S-methyltransferase [Rhodanobacteraceae bacterium]|nr:methylated-DNA--[protein]-cysteine S-methyltransferase [Rhodanobacteraceae bacterium]